MNLQDEAKKIQDWLDNLPSPSADDEDYWRIRCEAAEMYNEVGFSQNYILVAEVYAKWQELKNKMQ